MTELCGDGQGGEENRRARCSCVCVSALVSVRLLLQRGTEKMQFECDTWHSNRRETRRFFVSARESALLFHFHIRGLIHPSLFSSALALRFCRTR